MTDAAPLEPTAKPLRELTLAELIAMRNKIMADPENLGDPESKRIYKPRIQNQLWQIRKAMKRKMEAIALSRGETINFKDYPAIDIPMLR